MAWESVRSGACKELQVGVALARTGSPSSGVLSVSCWGPRLAQA